jgi:hypothetical protein
VVAAGAFAAASAQPFAGSWNDGSRLASVESLVERGTFCIDESVFLHPPPDRRVYDPHNQLLQKGTLDKLFIHGHWYSDKPPLVSLPLAAVYRLLMLGGAPAPSARPDVFAWIITVLLSGTGYAVAVGAMGILGERAGLRGPWRWGWLLAFALATVLPAYTRSANSHIAQLGAVAVVAVLLCRVADAARAGQVAWGSLAAVGFITSFIYNLDFGIGPPFAAVVLAIVALRTRNWLAVVVGVAAMLPGVVAGHALHYAIGGDWIRPLNMHREYLQWPGSPFAETMTGVVRPRDFAQVAYFLDLLVGRRGFLTHNLPLLLADRGCFAPDAKSPHRCGYTGYGEQWPGGFVPAGIDRFVRMVCVGMADVRGIVNESWRRLRLDPLVCPVFGARVLAAGATARRAAGIPPGFPRPERLGVDPGGQCVDGGHVVAAECPPVLVVFRRCLGHMGPCSVLLLATTTEALGPCRYHPLAERISRLRGVSITGGGAWR